MFPFELIEPVHGSPYGGRKSLLASVEVINPEINMLTNAAVKAARPRAAAYKLAHAGGLHLYVAPTPPWTWRWWSASAARSSC
jgi:hypothetical protein